MRGCSRCKTNVDGPLCPRCGHLTTVGAVRVQRRRNIDRNVRRMRDYGPTETYHLSLPKVLAATDIVEEAE